MSEMNVSHMPWLSLAEQKHIADQYKKDGDLLYALQAAAKAGAKHGIDQFEQEMEQSVSVLLKPHIKGVAHVVSNKVLGRNTLSDTQQQANARFCQQYAGQDIAVCELFVENGRLTVNVDHVPCPDTLGAAQIYTGDDIALDAGDYDHEHNIGVQIVFCNKADQDKVVSGMKSRWSQRLSEYADQHRSTANMLETIVERAMSA